jgi:hypothetical protein
MISRLEYMILSASLVASLSGLTQRPAFADDYPTSQRVIYVEDCMRQNPGPHYEMVNKCACALDHISKTTSYDDFVSMTTATNANTMAGERGNAIRDSDALQKMIRQFRDLEEAAKKSCFIGSPEVH